MESTLKQILERGLGDAKVLSIAWTEEDLTIDLALPASSGAARRLCLRFANIARLRMEMDYGEYVGQPLLFSAEAKEKDNGNMDGQVRVWGRP